MNKSTIIKLGLAGLALVFAVLIFSSFVSFSNTEISLRNNFEQRMKERVAFYDKMAKVISQKSQIAVKNDSSFRKNIDIIMSGRKDSEQVMFKWITESNPNADYREVSALYKDLSRSIEAQREGFFIEEKVLQDLVRQHTNHLQLFPNSFYNLFFGRDLLKYSPIQSDFTKEVFEKGIDNNVKLDL